MERISQLLYKYVQGNLSEAEHAELMAWAAADEANQQLLARLNNGEKLTADLKEWYAIPKRSVTDDARLDDAITQYEISNKQPRMRQLIRRTLSYAAVVILLIIAGTWYVKRDKVSADEQEIAAAEVLPGGNKATLTLADGRKIDLSSEQSGIIVKDEQVNYSNGAALAALTDKAKDQTVSQLELATPQGGTYQLTLPDGSQVWLNAASTIKYPSKFTGDARIVEISGEAYFDIRNDKQHPFKVRSKGQEIQVLGTAFNVAAYPGEAETKTTLVEGKVRLTSASRSENTTPSSNESVILSAGEQGSLRNGHITTSKVEITEFTAWKEGFFYFNGLPTTAAIAQLARWYNLDVVYEGPLPKANVYAYIDRNKPLSAILKALELSRLKFKITQSGDQKQLIFMGE